MKRPHLALSSALALLLGAAFIAPSVASAQTMNTGDPVKRGLSEKDFPRARQLAPNVYSYEALRAGDAGGKMTTVSLIVVTNAGVLVADGQGTIDQVKEMVDWIKKTTSQPIKYVVICSDHGDHTAGNPAFPAGVQYFASPASVLALSAGNAKPPAPLDTVPHRKVLHLGSTDIEILNLGRSHTGGDLNVYLPKDRVLFMSETYLHWIFPAMRSAFPAEWIQTLKNAESMDATWYVPGHGFVDDAKTLKADLPAYRHAVEQVVAEATRLHAAGIPCPAPAGRGAGGAAGGTARQPCEAALKGNWGDLKNWTLYQSQLETAIRRVYNELDGRLSP